MLGLKTVPTQTVGKLVMPFCTLRDSIDQVQRVCACSRISCAVKASGNPGLTLQKLAMSVPAI